MCVLFYLEQWNIVFSLNYTFIIFSDVEKTEKGQESTASKLSFRNFALVLDGLKDHSTIQKCFAKKLYWIPKTYVSRAEYCTATSLPLHFYFGYQMLQVNKLVEEIGHVISLFILRGPFIVYSY